jgi:adenosylcobyric acid synthase
MTILEPGLDMIRERTGRPVLGVIPYLGDLGLHEEDGIPLERIEQFKRVNQFKTVKIVVLRLRYISNFTDFDPFIYEPDVELIYSLRPEDIENADAVIIPGSKNTVNDLLFLKEYGIAESVKRAVEKGVMVIGICGGYQMLGKKLFDPCGIESVHKEVEGLGLLDIETVFEETKVTSQVEAQVQHGAWSIVHRAEADAPLRGYEIHMGRTTGDIGLFRVNRLNGLSGLSGPDTIPDGSLKGTVWGTYIHGIFDNDRFRSSLLNALRTKRGLEPVEEVVDYTKVRDEALDKWTKVLSTHVDIEYIADLLKV